MYLHYRVKMKHHISYCFIVLHSEFYKWSPVGLESPSMPILQPYWKDDEVVQTSSPMTEVPPRPLQSGRSDELGRTRLPSRSRQNLAPVAES